MSTITILPYELFVLILDLSMPFIDTLGLQQMDTCHAFVRLLNTLGSVCKEWRNVVHGTPSFWRVVCATFPMTVNSVILSRSQECQILVHFRGLRMEEDTQSQDFLQLTKEHRHRWGAAVLETPFEYMNSPLNHLASPAPLIQSIKLWITHLERTPEPMVLLGSQTQNLRNLQLRSVSIQWPSHTLTNLKTLVLSNIIDNAPTTQYVLDILACSPALEILELDWIMMVPSPTDKSLPRVHLPRLRCFRLRWISAEVANTLLRSISVTAGVITQFNIGLSADALLADLDRFFSETLLPFVEVYKHLNISHADRPGSNFFPRTQVGFAWRAFDRKSERFSLVVPGVQFSVGLRWLENVIGNVDPGVRAPLYLRTGVPGPFEVLKRSRVVSELALFIMCSFEHAEVVFGALEGSGSENGTDSTLDDTPAFPALRKVSLIDWPRDISRVEQMLLQRFTKRRTMGLSFPDLQIEFESVGYHSNRILHIERANRVREMEGVKLVRLGRRMQPGCLAVVWSEELCQPVWG